MDQQSKASLTREETLEKLQRLHLDGELSTDEYLEARSKVLTWDDSVVDSLETTASTPQSRQWAMFIHLSQYAGWIIPFAGLLLPIILWQTKKNEMPDIDEHGRNVANWLISSILYLLVFGFLSFLLIGLPFLLVVGLLLLIYPIIGGIKANNGEVWKYPGAIPFLKER